ncbi:maleylpyruvate isomerase N-terminal domain-containing protein [Streptomyces noursei]|uniref:maleylpyruvate isomerase N-terminal domain-containing protein n=1 Tax=Streptomyces noursei TaxID=1971 RepID=UPI0030F1F7CA
MHKTEALGPITASTDRFLQTVRALTDADIAGATLVPPWTRGHVITHVARATDSLCRLLTWARTGVETPQYASMDARAAEIEAGARRPVRELAADVVATAERFDLGWLTGRADGTGLTTTGPGPVPRAPYWI